MNRALITKWWWIFFNDPKLSWNKLVKSLYYSRRKLLLKGRAFVPYSQWWRGVLRCRDVFKCDVIYKLGDGKEIRMWQDIWIGESSLCTQFSKLLSRSPNRDITVAQCWNSRGWRWRCICRGLHVAQTAQSRCQLQLIKDLLRNLSPSSSPDSVLW